MAPFSKQRWRQIEAVLDKALDLDGEARDKYLDEACAADVTLRRDVEAFLADSHDIDTLLESSAQGLLADLLTVSDAQVQSGRDGLPRKLGRYRLLERVGSGGMGVVYRAERVGAPFEQEVAVKLLPAAKGRDGDAERFAQEQRVLASLSHPAIASLYDGGISTDGEPYLVMELVRGQPIDKYCRERKLTVRDTIDLCIQISQAVQYAHRNLIVHRDLKPSNILVTGEGRVKLLDFGIAKVLSRNAHDPELQTRTGQVLLTPELAAPEQIRNQPITIATDIYQLGIVIYQLLAGSRPFPSEGLSYYDMARTICEQEPPPPSSRSAPERRRTLKGDLDAIILKCIEKHPDRRYGSGDALTADLRAWLEGHPVAARPATAGMRMLKFVARHRWESALAGMLATLAVVYGVTMAVQSARIQRALETARDEASKATMVADLMSELFESAGPESGGRGSMKAVELLETASEALGAQRDGDPAVRAQLLTNLGRIYQSLAYFDRSEQLLAQALALNRSVLTGPAPQIARNLHDLGVSMRELGRYDEAREQLDAALAMWSALPNASRGTAAVLNDRGLLARLEGDREAAERDYRAALALHGDTSAAATRESATTLNNLGVLLTSTARFDEAEDALRDALQAFRRIFGDRHWHVAVGMNNLAAALRGQERYDEAEALHLQALALQESVLEAPHPHIASTLTDLGSLLKLRGRLDEAQPMFERALAMRQQVYGPKSAQVGVAHYRLGEVHLARGDLARAEASFRSTLEIDEVVYGPDHREVGRDLVKLASVMVRSGQRQEATRTFERALARLEPNSLSAASAHRELGDLALASGDFDVALDHLRRAYEVRRSRLAEGHSLTLEAAAALAGGYQDVGDQAAAEALWATVLEASRDDPAKATFHRLAAERLSRR